MVSVGIHSDREQLELITIEKDFVWPLIKNCYKEWGNFII
jgi:hypothetical protein